MGKEGCMYGKIRHPEIAADGDAEQGIATLKSTVAALF